MVYGHWTLTIVALFLAASAANAEDVSDYDPLFLSQDTLEIDVEGPFAFLARERPDEEEAPGKLRYVNADGETTEFDVQIRARGNWRRNPEICRFPPLRINFRKSQTDDTLFHKQDKIKLVTHCNNNNRYAQAVISEYLAYRIFNILTDYSYRVRLVNMTYVYTDRNETTNSFAVFIEHKDRLGKRIDGEPVETERVAVGSIFPENLNLASMFQYFIGNTDFSPIATAPDEDCCHNQALFTSEEGPYRTIPFDFDQTGLVDAKHAAPNPRFGIPDVKVRLYRGRCVNNELLPETLQRFRDKREEIEALIENQAELTSTTRRNLLRYVESFYDTIDNPRRVQQRIVDDCLG
ncbi:MAG: hypothetical protein QNJ23_06300 [Woeseiaceae bacterium]|nr:hypothetical protein [Woeseiaceae bacterium]